MANSPGIGTRDMLANSQPANHPDAALSPGGKVSVATKAALLVIASSLAHAAVGTVTTLYPAFQDQHLGLFMVSGAILTIGHAGVLIGVAALLLSGAAGGGTLRAIASLVACAGLGLLTVAEAAIRFDYNLGNTLFGIASPLTALGMILVGAALIGARAWHGWHRFTPLVAGLYIPLVLLPSFAISHGPNFAALTGWSLTFVAMGAAMFAERGTSAA
jgi:hypothetical protein